MAKIKYGSGFGSPITEADEIHPCLRSNAGGVMKGIGIKVAGTLSGEGWEKRHEQNTLEGQSIRRLTPTECEFLQGFYKNWTKYGRIEYANAKKEHALEVLHTLRETIGEIHREGWGFAEFIALLEKEILRQELYESELQRQVEGCGKTSSVKQSCQAISIVDALCEMWKSEKHRCSPQRQEQIEQLIKQLTTIVQKLPYEITSKRGWMEYRVCQEPTKKRAGEICSFVEISDSQRYKMCGNAVSVPVVKAVMEKLLKEMK